MTKTKDKKKHNYLITQLVKGVPLGKIDTGAGKPEASLDKYDRIEIRVYETT